MNPAKFCKQYAIYWAPAGKGPNGEETWSTSPVVIRARWDTVDEEEFRRMRLEYSEDTTVYGKTTVMLDTDVEVGGLLMEGDEDTLAALGVSYVPTETDEGIRKIKAFLVNPTLNAKYFLRRAIV